jgi:hypothetical protein
MYTSVVVAVRECRSNPRNIFDRSLQDALASHPRRQRNSNAMTWWIGNLAHDALDNQNLF